MNTAHRTVRLLVTIALLAGCSADPNPASPRGALAPAALRASGSASADGDLAALRAATARFHRFETALRVGWSVQFPAGCFASAAGGMGMHYLNPSTLGTLDPTQPQLLMYEPQPNGAMRLVGVEFLHPGAATDPAPTLFGQQFHWNAQFGIWALHVWAWEHNPSGPYADWNPRVSCAYAPAGTPAPTM